MLTGRFGGEFEKVSSEIAEVINGKLVKVLGTMKSPFNRAAGLETNFYDTREMEILCL